MKNTNDPRNGSDRPVVIVTGASSGIGRASAIRFAAGGWQIVASGRDRGRLEETERIAGTRMEMFVGSIEGVEAGKKIADCAVSVFGRLDAVVHCAATALQRPFDEVSPEEFSQTVRSNLEATFFLFQSAFSVMKNGKGGALVGISSLAAIDPFTGFSVYGSSKAWMDLLVRAIADEGRRHFIRAYSIRPGAVETPMLRGLFPDFPLEQIVSPETVAEMAWSMVNEKAWLHSSGVAVPVSAQ